MPFLGWFKQSEVDGITANKINQQVQDKLSAARVLIPYYLLPGKGKESCDKIEAIAAASTAREQGKMAADWLKEVHAHYQDQYNDLVQRYNQLLSITDVMREVRAVKALTAEVLVKLEEKEK